MLHIKAKNKREKSLIYEGERRVLYLLEHLASNEFLARDSNCITEAKRDAIALLNCATKETPQWPAEWENDFSLPIS